MTVINRIRTRVAVGPALVRLLVLAMSIVLAACNNSNGGSGY
jgi:hypothetical protein